VGLLTAAASRRLALGLYAVCASVFVLCHPGRIDTIDAQFKYETTHSLIEHGDLRVRDAHLLDLLGSPAVPYAPYGLAPAITGIPLAWLGLVLGPANRDLSQFLWSLTPALLGALTPLLLYRVWRRLGVKASSALGWSLVVAFASLLCPSASSSFDQAPQAALLLATTWSARQALVSRSCRWAAGSGLCAGLLVHYQPALIVLSVPIGIALLATSARSRGPLRLWWRLPIAFSVGVAPAIALLLVANAQRFGGPLELGQLRDAGIPLFGSPLNGALVVLASPGKSLLLFSPSVLLAFLGWRGFLRVERALPTIGMAVLATHVLLVSSLSFPGGDWCWGPRYLVVSLPLVYLGLPWSSWVPRFMATSLIAVSAAVQALGLALDHHRFFFERALHQYFWLDNLQFYFRESQLFARFGELTATAPDAHRYFSSGPSPLLTYAPFGPPPHADPAQWVEQFAVFYWPRPWPLWMHFVPEDLRFLAPAPVTMVIGLVALCGVAAILHGLRKAPIAPVARC
jgi:hypothetical protein